MKGWTGVADGQEAERRKESIKNEDDEVKGNNESFK